MQACVSPRCTSKPLTLDLQERSYAEPTRARSASPENPHFRTQSCCASVSEMLPTRYQIPHPSRKPVKGFTRTLGPGAGCQVGRQSQEHPGRGRVGATLPPIYRLRGCGSRTGPETSPFWKFGPSIFLDSAFRVCKCLVRSMECQNS